MTDFFKNNIVDNCVIGSGPSGVFCSLGLLEKGETVHMIDIGKTIDLNTSSCITTLSQSAFSEWAPEDYESLIQLCLPQTAAMPVLKQFFGSDYLYDGHLCDSGTQSSKNLLLYSAQSKGGFSKVWGTNVMPFHEKDMVRWPIGIADLAPYYKKVCEHTPYTACTDRISTHFPLYGTPTCVPQCHEQSQHVLNILENHHSLLADHGVCFGHSRLMAHLEPPWCQRCGLCLMGCPYNLLYSTDMTLDTLSKNTRFQYHSPYHLDSFEETEAGVTLSCLDQKGNAVLVRARRVFLGAGALQTSKIVLKSIPSVSELTLHDSHYFLVPAYTAKSILTHSSAYHSLAHLYLDICNPILSSHWIHLQLYGYNLFYTHHIQKLMRWAYYMSPRLFNYFIGKLWAIQGYLHSDESSTVRLRYNPHSNTLSTRLIPSKILPSLLSNLYGFLNKISPYTGLNPIQFMAKDRIFNRGFHSGGTLPMSATPSVSQTSTLGKLWCSNRVYVIDSSVFPSIPATTITYSVMANAYRIGRLS